MTGFEWFCAALLYFCMGSLIDEVAKKDPEEPKSFILIAIWPVLVVAVIFSIIRKYIKASTAEVKKAIDKNEDDLDEWNM